MTEEDAFELAAQVRQLDDILLQRGPVHGPAEVQFAIAQDLKQYFRRVNPNLHPVLQEGLDQIAVKISRILAGDQFFDDHWLDISGYAECTRKLIPSILHAVEQAKAAQAVQLTANPPKKAK